MNHDREDDRDLRSLLRALPRERADDGFAADVLDAARRPPRVARTPILGLAAAAAIAVALVLGLRPERQPTPPAVQEPRLETISREYARLEAEWAALQRMRAATRPVIYLGATERADLVLDLEHLARRRSGTTRGLAPDASGVRPAVLSHGDNRP